jgi:DNA-binding NarL/FixJ family response regulator
MSHVHHLPASRGLAGAGQQLVRLVIFSNHALVRRGLRAVARVASGLELVGEAGEVHELATLVAGLRPDVVLLDLAGPDAGSLATIAAIRHAWPEARIVIVATFDHVELALGPQAIGADAYLLKDVDVADLLRVIRQVRPVTQRRHTAC